MTTAPAAHPMAPPSRENRPLVVGPSTPEPPYPLRLEGSVTSGFGRGARVLGIPTANLPASSLGPLNDLHLTGIYYGFARVHPSFPSTSSPPSTTSPPPTSATAPSPSIDPPTLSSQRAETAPYPPDSIEGSTASPQGLDSLDEGVWPMVMSVGWNPYFKNEKITAEVHIMHPFKHDFYGLEMSVLALGYIRPELDYVSTDALIQDIQTDVKVAFNSLARPGYAELANDPFLLGRQGRLQLFHARR